MIQRVATERLLHLAKTFRSVAVAGPRQSGKTTLCRAVFPEKAYVSLENPDTLEFANSDPLGFLAQYTTEKCCRAAFGVRRQRRTKKKYWTAARRTAAR
ncbi:MAG: AAA family ATPase [Cytophagaceae bacterium]|nr:AAA family ATPase [Cytophagaceae bacterium]